MRWGAFLLVRSAHNPTDDGIISVDHHREATPVFILRKNACRQNSPEKVKRCLESRFIAELPLRQSNHPRIEPEYSNYDCNTVCFSRHNP